MRTITINAHCRDSFELEVDADKVQGYYHGYVPSFLDGGGGDTVKLTIDIDTGRIVDWVAPSSKELKQLLKENT